METGKIDTLQSVELAEGVEIRLRVAGPMTRAGAYLIDMALRLMMLAVCGIGLAMAGVAVGGRVAYGFFLLFWFLLDWIYPIFFEAGKRGATPGKRAVGLRVVQSNGSPITTGQAVVRNFLRFVDGMPFFMYAFGVVSCLATRRFQRLGDLAAGTVVIYDRAQSSPPFSLPSPVAPMPVPVALNADEIRAITLFRERAAFWSEGRRIEIADQAAELTGARGPEGVSRLMAMAIWLQEKRE